MENPRKASCVADNAGRCHQAAADRVYERIEAGESFDVEAALMDAHLNIPPDIQTKR